MHSIRPLHWFRKTPETPASRKAFLRDHEATPIEKKPQAQECTFEEREEAEKKATKERRAAAAAQQSLKKRKKAAERAAAARRGAQRQDDILQKQMLDRYGYGPHILASETDEPEAIEMSLISWTMDDASEQWAQFPQERRLKGEDPSVDGMTPEFSLKNLHP